MRVLIIDGQGGRMGAQLVEGLKNAVPAACITAVGTNAIATSAMVRAGALQAATGENAVVVNSRRADIIAGPLGIVMADSLLGEITPAMAAAVAQSEAFKVLLPVNRCNHVVVGVQDLSMGQLISQAVQRISQLCSSR
ncbi:MAG TPA: DUF3842 family protein [Candidatus Anaerofilum faecale]|nr:DUF3842 family protein [Anaerofilum sp. An201]OUP04897.1 hypothetical protein B5F36_02750 [Anaerofilum sp. An201]HIX13222.1 DUF3842 family protein [Candidatus Anaerofilum faecale]